MLIAQLSDLHLVAPGARLYGHVDTAAALASAIARVNSLAPRPDLVVFSGDLVNHGRSEEYAHLRAQLAGLACPYGLMPGNHDERAALHAAFPEQAFAGAPLLCQRVDLGELSLLLLDTVIAGAEGGEVGAAQLAWLDAACPPARPAMLFLHHPPFATGIAGMDAIGLAGSERLAGWLERHRNVRALAAGHVHRSVFSLFAGIPVLIAPSPAHQIALDLAAGPSDLAYTLEPGGFLLHRWDGHCITSHVVPVAAAAVHRYD